MQKINEKLRFKSGIYEFFNLENGKRYVGSSKDIYNRLHEHYHNLNNNKAHNKHFQSAWNKYGEESFVYNVLEFCSEESRFEREQYYIDVINPEYNLTNYVIANTGHAISDECKEKISETLKRKYASGEIQTYKQDHAWIKCYIYNIRTFKFEAECKCLSDAVRLLGNRKSSSSNHAFKNLFLNRYIITKNKFENLNELINYASEHFLVANSTKGKYIVIERPDKTIKYYRELTSAAQENSSSKSTLSKHGDATRENPFLIRKSNCLFYYTNEFMPITGYEAVPIEESSELLSGNIGETPEMDNTEINSEIKESESSYSVEVETL